MTSLSFFRQGFTGITAAALAGSSLLAITTNAQAASLDYDCFSRQTGELLIKSAIDMTSLDLACLASAEAMVQGQHNPNLNVVYTTQPVPVQSSSSGEAFLGGVVGGILGGVIEGSMNRGHDYDHGHGYEECGGLCLDGQPLRGKGPGKRPGKRPGNVGTRPGVKLPNLPKSTVYPKLPGIPNFPGKQSPSISGDRLRGLSNIKVNRTIQGLHKSSNLKVHRNIPLKRIQPLGGLGL
ncbi:hypothetical protein [Synechococcus sp. NB0720_010]|uniref:hypothetical protein n=1 Tax=Synechococcus sp. NB0720_010 TaxID=2907159 RepID=UPI001FFACCE8|nr:hypothetical protein [Synechococcus sp. NB0720_010]UPH90041.1 hypothetical protein LY254_12415 [Synechococcus sp. NB0720_010]